LQTLHTTQQAVFPFDFTTIVARGRVRPTVTRAAASGVRAAAASLACLLGLMASAAWAAAPPVAPAVQAASDYTIIGLPDTQKYTGEIDGGQVGMWEAQTQWIVANRQALNIVYVAHYGDCVEHGNSTTEWNRFEAAMDDLEPAQTGLPYGIPYGITVGNHDQSPAGSTSSSSTLLFNQYFGVSRFSGRSYYGGHYGSNNDNHYDLFTAGGEKFIALYLEYDSSATPSDAELGWADDVLRTHSDRRAIVVRHELISSDALKDNPNLFLMLCGHLSSEGRRSDTFNGSTVHTVLTDYQSRTNGGNGYLRIMTFSPSAGEIRVKTYSPWLDQYETDSNSQFTLPFTPSALTITASADPQGTISPSGEIGVLSGGSQSFTITPNAGYIIADVLVDDVSVGPVASYAFNAVTTSHTIHATFASEPVAGGSVRFEQTASGGTLNLASVTTTELVGVAGDLYLAAVSSRSFAEPTSVSGLGLAWTRVRNQCGGRNLGGVVLYVAQGVPSGNGSVTATFASARASATLIVNRYSGAATLSPIAAVVSGNTLGVSGSCSGGSDNNAYSLPITTTVPGSLVFGAASMRNTSHTPGPGFVERNERKSGSSGSGTSSIAVMDGTPPTGPTTVSGAFSQDVDWAVIAIEIRPGDGGEPQPTPDIAATPASHDFGSVAVGATSTQQFVVRNDGNADLSVAAPTLQGGNTSHFDIVSGGTAVVLGPGDTHNISVRFEPNSSGTKSTTLRISSNDPDEDPLDIALTGSAFVQTPDITVNPTSHAFGVITPPASAQQVFQVGNSGNGDLVVTAVSTVGADAAEFTVGALTLPFTLAPGGTRNVTVTFTPSTTALRSATLRIASSDPDEASVDVPLSGGQAQPETFTITASAGPQGTITPSGEIDVQSGGSQSFTITPDQGFFIADVVVDGVSVGPVTSYTFNAISSSHTIHATFAEMPVAGGSVRFEQTASGATLSLASVTTTDLVGVAGHLYLAAVSSRNFAEPTSVSGLGLAWTRVRSQCAGRNQTGIALYVAQGVPSGNGPVTATFASALKSATLVVNRYSGAATLSPIGAVVSGNTGGVSGACSGGTDSNAYSLPITTSVPGALVFGAATMRNAAHTPGPGFVERNEQMAGSSGSSASSIAVMDATPPGAATTVSGTFSKIVDWAVIAIEVRPGDGGEPQPTPDIAVTPASHDFGSVAVGDSSTQQFVVRNDGDADLSVAAPTLQGGNTSHFDIVSGGTAVVLGPGDTHNISVRFEPTSSGTKSTTLRISSNDPDEDPLDIALTGSAFVQTPDITVNPTSHAFGVVTPPDSAQQTFQVGNSGNGDLVVTAVSIVGADAAEFTVEAPALPFTLAPSDTLDIIVTFTPSTTELRSATLRIASDDPDEASLDVPLSGGEAPPGIVFGEVQSGTSASAASVTTSAPLLARAGDLYLAAVSCKSNRQASSVQGLGLVWSRVDAQCSGRNQTGVDLWIATGTPAAVDGAVTATFASAPSGAAIVVSRYSGASGVLGAVVSANSIGLDGACANGIDAATYSVPLPPVTPNAVVYAAVALRNTSHTPGNDFVERLEVHSAGGGSGAGGLAVVERTAASGDLSGTFGSLLDWAAVAVEIRPAGAAKMLAADEPSEPAAVAGIPRVVVLDSAPNPFNPRTTIHFGLPEARSVRLSIYDIAGRRIRVLVDGVRGAGMHEAAWAGIDASDRQVPSGIYLAVLEAGNVSRSLKLLLTK
jgi:hypothetical protein